MAAKSKRLILYSLIFHSLITLHMKPRSHIRNRFVFIGDVALIIVSVLGSFALRLDVGELPFYFPAVVLMSIVALIIKLPVFYFFGLYRRLWIYASTGELRLIVAAVTTASVLTSGVMATLIVTGNVYPGMPRSALGIDWLLSLVLIGGSRFALRILAEQSMTARATSSSATSARPGRHGSASRRPRPRAMVRAPSRRSARTAASSRSPRLRRLSSPETATSCRTCSSVTGRAGSRSV